MSAKGGCNFLVVGLGRKEIPPPSKVRKVGGAGRDLCPVSRLPPKIEKSGATPHQHTNIREGKEVSTRDKYKAEDNKRHHTMLIPPLKKSQPCDIKDRCGQYLRSTHSPEEAAAHADALKSLQDQRTKCISIVEPSAENIEILLRWVLASDKCMCLSLIALHLCAVLAGPIVFSSS